MDEELPKLTYTVLPESVYYTRDAQSPSMALITIGASNTTEANISITGFQVVIVVSSDVKKADALTATPSSIIPASLQPLVWDFQQIDDGVYYAKPVKKSTTMVAPGESITFQLQGVTVNEAAGTTIITIAEIAGVDVAYDYKTIGKIKSKLEITKFEAVPDHIPSGDASILSWTTEAAARVTLSPGEYPDIKPTDSVTVKPGTTTFYTLTAYGEGPNVSAQKIISIDSPQIVDFKSSASKVDAGDSVTLSWNVLYADDISISPGDHKGLPAIGTLPVQIWTETNFILTAKNKGNETANRPAPVGINPVTINFFRATPSYGARLGEPVALTWDIKSAVSASVQYGTINGIDQNKFKNGGTTVIPNTGVAYSLIAQNSLGTTMSSIELFPMPLGWHQFTTSAPLYFPELPVVLNFKTDMWVMASNFMNTVYHSFDGANWIPSVGYVPWQTRSFSAGIVFMDKMWLMGGLGTNGSYLNDVWSSPDGVTWTQETNSAQWSARRSFGCFTLPGKDKIFIIGGLDSSGNALTDVWSSPDGKTWTLETAAAFQNGRCAFGMVTYGDSAWVLGGLVGGDESKGKPVNEVWYSANGISWSILSSGITWKARSYPVAGALSNGIYLSGGLDAERNGIYDMHRMSADKKWTIQKGFQFKDIRNTAGVEYQDALWFIGGALLGGQSPNQNTWAYAPSRG